jgi:hypothetical protein
MSKSLKIEKMNLKVPNLLMKIQNHEFILIKCLYFSGEKNFNKSTW